MWKSRAAMLILHNKFGHLTAAPKNLKENKEYRKNILRIAEVSPAFREECWIRAKHDYVWFVDTFGWTYNPKQYPTTPRRFFILREYQEDLARALINSIGKHSVAIPKSRDMGGSWVALTVLEWIWQFNDDPFTALMGSWKQDFVDKRGDPNSLFWKLDYFLNMQPVWLRPRIRPGIERTQNSLINPLNNSALTGEATNPDFGRAGRPAVCLLDELASVDCAQEVLNSTSQATNTRWMISTYKGAFGAFWNTVQTYTKNTPERVVALHWTLHPGKRRGLYQFANNKLVIIDKLYHWPKNEDGSIKYKFVNDGTDKLRSPWYDAQEIEMGSRQAVAQELDMEAQASGYQYLDTNRCNELCIRQGRPPRHRGFLQFKDAEKDEIKFKEDPTGDVEIWVTLNNRMQPPSDQDYASGADIAQGTVNEDGSNSSLAGYSALTNEKSFHVLTNKMPPETFARYCVACCRFFKGKSGNGALLNWERNGPGNAFSIAVVNHLKYGNVWYSRDLRKKKAKKGDLPGFHTDDESKRTVMNAYREAMTTDRLINRKKEAIMECAQYINLHERKYVHQGAQAPKDPSCEGDAHGDMVISDALAYLALNDLPAFQAVAVAKLPETSIAALEEKRLASETKSRGSWGFSKRRS
jgi:hypothetical protein